MATGNMVPSMQAAGRFEAVFPFDQIVNPEIYYSVEALETITKMEVEKENLYELMFKPIGVSETDYPTILERARSVNAYVITLLDRQNKAVYVFTNYLKSFPEVDGISYEIMCLVANLGAQNPNNATLLEQCREHMRQYIFDTLGINAEVSLGTIPTIGYVSQAQSDAYEAARKELITNTSNDISRIRELEELTEKQQIYIAKLEAAVPVP